MRMGGKWNWQLPGVLQIDEKSCVGHAGPFGQTKGGGSGGHGLIARRLDARARHIFTAFAGGICSFHSVQKAARNRRTTLRGSFATADTMQKAAISLLLLAMLAVSATAAVSEGACSASPIKRPHRILCRGQRPPAVLSSKYLARGVGLGF